MIAWSTEKGKERWLMGRIKKLIRNLNYLSKHSLWDQREEDIVYLTNKILDDGIYEYGIEINSKTCYHILNAEDSLSLLEQYPKSFVRTSDGEVKLMSGIDQPFQKYEKEIADSLIKSISIKREDMYVGINRNYFISLMDSEGRKSYYRRHGYDHRTVYKKYLNFDITYLDADFTAYPLGQPQNEKYNKRFERWRNLFKDKCLIIVCGKGILDEYSYDVFGLAKEKIIVDGPRVNGWNEKNRLLSQITRYDKKIYTVIFILGMAGKAMIPILTDEGYMCWDVGHLAKYYNAYMSGHGGTEEEIRKFYAPD